MEYLDSLHPEWGSMWQALASYPLNQGDATCTHQGHNWEYLGSSDDHHHFSHLCHPVSNKTEYAYLERIKLAAGWG